MNTVLSLFGFFILGCLTQLLAFIIFFRFQWKAFMKREYSKRQMKIVYVMYFLLTTATGILFFIQIAEMNETSVQAQITEGLWFAIMCTVIFPVVSTAGTIYLFISRSRSWPFGKIQKLP